MAASIPNEFIEDLLNRTDIYDIISARVTLKKAGKDYSGLCPFHSENTPSFTLSQSKQFYHCFGCGKHGTAIGFLMDYEGLDFVDVIDDLAQKVGLQVPASGHKQYNKKSKNLYEATEKANALFKNQLKTSKLTIDYLQARNISGEVSKTFQLGYAKNQWDGLLDYFGLENAELLFKTGLISSNDNNKHYDKFRNRLMFPIQDKRGRVIAFGGRALEDDQNPKYLNSPETDLFHKGNELYGYYLARKHSKEKHVFVVEGYMDVIALHQFEIKNAVATLGTATSSQHIQSLFKSWQQVIFCFDGDRAGRQAAEKALMTALPLYLDKYIISFLFLPDGQDPDSYVNEIGKEKFEKIAQEAMSLSEYLLEIMSTGINIKTTDGKAQFLQKSRDYLKILPKGEFKKLMISKIARLTNSNFNLADSYPRVQRVEAQQNPTKKLLSLLLQNPKLVNQVPKNINLLNLPFKGIEIVVKIIEICRANPQIGTAVLIEQFRNEDYFEHLGKLTHENSHLDDKQKDLEFSDMMNFLQKMLNKMKIDKLREKQQTQGLDNQEKQKLIQLLTNKIT
ncbi:MAG: DNA primase [Proteobacteria bacterium]|nr:DNA primase [Pseudomonadota bacterium]